MTRPKRIVSAALLVCCLTALASPTPLSHSRKQLAQVPQYERVSDRGAGAQAPPVASIQQRRRLLRRAPPPGTDDPGVDKPDGPGTDDGSSPTVPPPSPKPTADPPATTTNEPLPNTPTTTTTTTTTTSTTTTTTTTSSSSSSTEEESTTSRHQPSRPVPPTRPTHSQGGIQPPPVHSTAGSTNATSTPTGKSEPDDGKKPPLLPIILGSVIGGVILIATAIFFIWRWRKSRRFDSKRPLSFVSLPTDMQDVDFEKNTGRPLTSQPSLRYTPPADANTFVALARSMGGGGPNNTSSEYRGSFNPSQHSSTMEPYIMDDENTRLVTARDGIRSASPYPGMAGDGEDAYGLMGMGGGGGSRMPQRLGSAALIGPDEDELVLNRGGRPESGQSFVATSMVPVAHDDPIHTRYSRTMSEVAYPGARASPASSHLEPVTIAASGSPIMTPNTSLQYQSVSMQQVSSPVSRPISLHSEHPRASSVLSVRNPSEPGVEDQDGSLPRSEELQYL